FVPLIVLVALTAGLWWGLAPASAGQVHAWLSRFLWAAHTPAGPLAAAVITAAAVLIVACPCAMGLATPVALMARAKAAARRGILIRDAVALEKASKITAILFDKTGTLTEGKPSIGRVWDGQPDAAKVPQPGNGGAGSESELFKAPVIGLAAALARHSSHPVS